jgi:diguanylate cyclase (GGDEF)-like protein
MLAWWRVALTALVAVVTAVARLTLGPELGESLVVVTAIGVVAIAWLSGGALGFFTGLGVGLYDVGALTSVPDLESVAALVHDGALVTPLTLAVLGLAAGGASELRRQVALQREAFDRTQYDVLTGLLNRQTFERRLGDWMTAGPSGAKPAMFAVLFVDLDRFKFVNDTFGHDTGDKLLKAIGTTLRENVREGDLVARLGGDEFVVALKGLSDRETAAVIAGKLVRLLSTPYDLGERTVSVSASIGVAVYPRDGEDVAALTMSADNAMYAVKSGGKNAFYFSTVEMRTRQNRRLEIERALRHALHDNEFEMVYQPQVELETGRLVGFEALLRWNSRELGMVPPREFIPIAEDAGMIVPIGHWLLREACFQLASWLDLGRRDLKVGVNVSTVQFRQSGFVDTVAAAVRDARIEPHLLEIEITESVLIEELELAVQILRRLDRVGVRTALDDFGTGYSSLAYLQRLPIQTLKIDRSFVSALALSPTGRAGAAVPIVEAITAMGRKLGKRLVGEGIETQAQARYLSKIGVELAQGYLYARPMSAAAAGKLIERAAEPKPAAVRDRPRSPNSERVTLMGD